MAGGMLHASMMPTIKCSSCGSEVHLAMMGDHICVPDSTNLADKQTSSTNHDRLTTSLFFNPTSPINTSDDEPLSSVEPASPTLPVEAAKPTSPPRFIEPIHPTPPALHVDLPKPDPVETAPSDALLQFSSPEQRLPTFQAPDHPRSPRPKPPPIDSVVANGHRAFSDPLTPLTGNKLAGISPPTSQGIMRATGFRPPGSLPKPPLTPLSAGFPPPSLAAQLLGAETAETSHPHEHVFSSLPMNASQTALRSRPNTPPVDQQAKSPWFPQTPSEHSRSDSRSGPNKLVRRKQSISNDIVLKRSDTVSEKSTLGGLFRRKSARSMSISKKDISAPEIRGTEVIPPLPQVPAAMMRAVSDPITKVDDDGAALPNGPAPPRPVRPAEPIDGLLNHFKTNDALPTMRKPRSHERKVSAPITKTETVKPPLPEPPFRSDSDVSNYVPQVPTSPERPPLSSGSSGLPQINEVDDSMSATEARDPPPSAWPTGRLRSATRSDHVTSRQSSSSDSQAPPLPRLTTSQEFYSQHRHTPSDSASSSGCSRFGFDDRTDSGSISTPPTSTVSSFMQWKSSMDGATGSPPSIMGTPLGDNGPMSPAARSSNFSRPRAPTARGDMSSMVLSPESPELQLESKMDQGPAAPFGNRMSPASSDYSSLPRDSQHPSEPAQQPLPGRPSTRGPNGSRSKCRGCGEAIVAKSIKASDGRLTGRYHKECFTCKSCKSPFPTADFYVLRDEPYCAYHYHVLNKSMCDHCNRGIEGRYLELESRRKLHVECLSCHDCQRSLTWDYFEVGGRVYCELDARRHHQRSASRLGQGPGVPERRTTRLVEF